MPLQGPAWSRVPTPLRTLRDDELTLPNLLRVQAQACGDSPLVRNAGQDRTYADTLDAVARRGGGLVEHGVKPGDRIAIMSANRLEVLDLILACSWIGAIPVMVNVALRGVQLHHIMANSGARILVCEGDLIQHLAGAADKPLPMLERVWALDELTDDEPDRSGFAVTKIPRPSDAIPARDVKPSDTAVIIYTSGTTGLPKGVICPQAQLFWWGANTGWNLGLKEDDVVSTCLPLFHTNALSAFVQALMFGATYALGSRFSASRFWSRARDERATVTFLLGAMVRILLAQPASAVDEDHSVRIALSPATPPDALAEFRQRFGVSLLEAYGSTETNHVMGSLPEDSHPGTMGKVLPGFDARVVDENDVEQPDGEPGELILRHDEPFSFAMGYYGMPDKTVAAWRNLWFHTGDRVVRDHDGRFRFLDRLTDSIRRRGENISSYEVEAAITTYCNVEAVAVYPVPSELGEDEVMAAVVPRDPRSFTPESLIQALQGKLAAFAIPRYIEIVDALPLTENGKVRKAVLRAQGVTEATWSADTTRP